MTVKVSLLEAQGYRASKADKVILYPAGIVEMPIEHAREMGLLHRIVRSVETATDGTQVVQRLPFNGAFDTELSDILAGAGYKTIEDLSRASQDELFAIKGIGPANFERIQHAVKGG